MGNRLELFVRRLNAATTALAGAGKIQGTKDGPAGGNIWRNDGKEVFYVRAEPGSDEFGVTSVEVTPGTTLLLVSEPKLLFKLRDTAGGNTKVISRDGERFVFSIRQPAR